MSTQTRPVEAPALSEIVRRNVAGVAAFHGVHQSQLGRMLGLSRGAISQRYRGLCPFTLNEVQQVADVLGVELAELLSVDRWAPRGSNPQPTDYGHAQVIELAAWRESRAA